MSDFVENKCYGFDKLIAASRKDDVGKEDWLVTCKDISLETDYDQNLGCWTYELVWHGAGPVKRTKLTPFSFKQFCTKFKCPSKFMLQLPGNIAKQNIDFFKMDAKEDDLLIRVKAHSEGFFYARGMVKPSTPVINNSDLLKAIQEPISEHEMRVWKAHFRDHDFHAKLIYGDTVNIGSIQNPDNVNIGVHVANSEVGARPTELQVMVFRLVCTNGLIHMIDGVPLFRKTSFNMSRDDVTREIRNALQKIENHKERILGQFQDAATIEVKTPYKVISALGKQWKLSKSEIVAITDEFNKGKAIGDYSYNKISIVNSITRVAQNYDAETRFNLENIAGQFLADRAIIEKLNEAADKVKKSDGF